MRRSGIARRAFLAMGAVGAIVLGCGSSPASTAQPTPTLATPTQTPTVTQLPTSVPTAAATIRPGSSASAAATSSPTATRNPSAGYTDLPGWLVFEHFGQAPDGSTPTFDFDNRMIWMAHADGSGLHELAPGTPGGGKVSPDISPDGRTVAFNTWSEPVQIWTAPIEGGVPTQISTECSGYGYECVEVEPSYSGDGTKLAFVRQSTTGGPTSTEIGIRDLQSGAVTMLDSTKTDFGLGYITQPSFSPDGKAIVYYKADQRRSDEHITDARLVVVNSDGSDLHELPQPTGEWAADPDWSPDGTQIVFSTQPNREGEGWGDIPGHSGIWTISPDGTGLSHVCDGCLVAPDGGHEGGIAPSWTSDGRVLFWGFKTWALMNADGSDAAHINQAKLTWNGDGLGYNYAAFLQPTP